MRIIASAPSQEMVAVGVAGALATALGAVLGVGHPYWAMVAAVAPLTARGIPSTFLLATDRTLLDSQVGYAPNVEDRWKKILEKHLRTRK